MFLRFAGPIHEVVLPPDGSARAIGRRRHIPAGASHDGSRLRVVREAAPAASAARWACERPDAQANRDNRNNECSPCDHAVNPATYDMVDASTWSQVNLNRADIAECGLGQCSRMAPEAIIGAATSLGEQLRARL
jgi:heterodisulfide reductase subunit A-like polyferredoxin